MIGRGKIPPAGRLTSRILSKRKKLISFEASVPVYFPFFLRDTNSPFEKKKEKGKKEKKKNPSVYIFMTQAAASSNYKEVLDVA